MKIALENNFQHESLASSQIVIVTKIEVSTLHAQYENIYTNHQNVSLYVCMCIVCITYHL